MQNQERHPAVNLIRATLTAASLPFRWIGSLPAAGVALMRERNRSAERARFDTSKWTLELLRHLEWRRFEELCVAYFEALGFTASARPAADGSADVALQLEGAGAA